MATQDALETVDLQESLNAIIARVNGDFNSPHLANLGPVSTMANDILSILKSAVAKAMCNTTKHTPGRWDAVGPELLDILTKIVSDWDNYEESGPIPADDLMEEARAAIYKAKGE